MNLHAPVPASDDSAVDHAAVARWIGVRLGLIAVASVVGFVTALLTDGAPHTLLIVTAVVAFASALLSADNLGRRLQVSGQILAVCSYASALAAAIVAW